MINVLVMPRDEQNDDALGAGSPGLLRVREHLVEANADLSDVGNASVPSCVRHQMDALIQDLDALLAGDREKVEARRAGGAQNSSTVSAEAHSIDIAVLAAAIADHLRQTGEIPQSARATRRRKSSSTRRRSLLSSFLQVDVILSTVALLAALSVLFAWMG